MAPHLIEGSRFDGTFVHFAIAEVLHDRIWDHVEVLAEVLLVRADHGKLAGLDLAEFHCVRGPLGDGLLELAVDGQGYV